LANEGQQPPTICVISPHQHIFFQQVLTTSLGPAYSTHFTSFDHIPFAAASIGQVHRAVLSASSSPTGKEEPVAVKIQFPNIVNSIESDLGYVKMLLTAGSLLPKGLFLDRTIQVGVHGCAFEVIIDTGLGCFFGCLGHERRTCRRM
jgi:predicted unusual protein kinase regulating ubiquinone biosynthesis (AarF/ABC1/UbiB family)